jgi:dihydrolipoamide dehydrogenase
MTEANENRDLVVIGGGPAGYAAAIRAGQLGHQATVVEVERPGGTCLNWGCIPSKALLRSAELYQQMLHAEDLGLSCKNPQADFAKVMARSRTVADQMAGGIEFLFRKNKVEYLRGHGRLEADGSVRVTEGPDEGSVRRAGKILLTPGCVARMIPGVEHDGTRVMTSRDALALQHQPASVAIIGAGAIGAEFAYFLNAMGTTVTLVEMQPRILPVEDEDISEAVARAFAKQGIDVRAGTSVGAIEPGKKSVQLTLEKDGSSESLEVESVLVAIGVQARLEGLLGEGVELELEKGYLKTGTDYQTSQPGVYAAGDVIGPPWLAHVATYEALQAVNGMFAGQTPQKVQHFPGCTYCQPQVASVGLRESDLKEAGTPYRVGKFPFTASGKAVAAAHSEGFVKLLVSEDHGEILGAHIVGAEATELITEYVLAMDLEATADEIHHSIHAHPTLSEALMEAAAATRGEAIHI